MEEFKFSIVIPVFNNPSGLARALSSILVQDFSSYEVIVCDDGSNTTSDDVVDQYLELFEGKLKFIKNPANSGGPANPRNNSIAVAQGEWICFLDCDDWWLPTKLSSIARFTEQFDVVYHPLRLAREGTQTRRLTHTKKVNIDVFRDLMLSGNLLPLSGTSVRREILQKVGKFREEAAFVAIEDYEMWLRISLSTFRFKFLGEVLGFYECGGQGISKGDPIRNLQRLSAVSALYIERLPEHERQAHMALVKYATGVGFFNAGDLLSAREFFKQSLFRNNWSVSVRAFVRVVQCYLHMLKKILVFNSKTQR